MANTDPGSYNGFQQYSGNGSAPTYEQVEFPISYNSANIFTGDPVIWSNGYIVQGTTSAGSGNDQIAGVFVGCKYLSAAFKRDVWSNYYPGGTDPQTGTIYAYVINDPNAKFVAWSDATGLTQNDVGANVGYNIGVGNTANGISGAYINSGTVTPAADSSLPFKVMALVSAPPGVNGTASGAYARAIVAFNNVTTKQLTGI